MKLMKLKLDNLIPLKNSSYCFGVPCPQCLESFDEDDCFGYQTFTIGVLV